MTECHHHWLVDPPTAPTSHAHCKLCGKEATFSNNPLYRDQLTLPGVYWNGNIETIKDWDELAYVR